MFLNFKDFFFYFYIYIEFDLVLYCRKKFMVFWLCFLLLGFGWYMIFLILKKKKIIEFLKIIDKRIK